MERETLIAHKIEIRNFDWSDICELDKLNQLGVFVTRLNENYTPASFQSIKNSLLSDINYHLYILKKYGNADSRSEFNVNDVDYLSKLWTSFLSHLIKKGVNANTLYPYNESDKKAVKLKSELVINYLEWFIQKIEHIAYYGDAILFVHQEQNRFLNLYVNQN